MTCGSPWLETYLKQIFHGASKGLEIDPSNFYLANFIGVFMAERNYLENAKHTFKKCLENISDETTLLYNLAFTQYLQVSHELVHNNQE